LDTVVYPKLPRRGAEKSGYFGGWKQFVGTGGFKLLRLEVHGGTEPNGFPAHLYECAFNIAAGELFGVGLVFQIVAKQMIAQLSIDQDGTLHSRVPEFRHCRTIEDRTKQRPPQG